MGYATTKMSLGAKDEVVTDTAVNTTVSSDVLVGSGKVYSIHLKNDHASNPAYFRAADLTAPTVGTTPPSLMLKIAANTEKSWTIVDGLAFTNFSFWATTGGDDDNAVAADDLKAFLALR